MRQGRLLDCAVGGGHEHVVVIVELLDRQYRGDLFVLRKLHQIDNRLAPARTAPLWNLINLEPIDATAIRETQDVIMRVRHKQTVDEIIFLGARRLPSTAATSLRTIVDQSLRFDIARV